MSYEHKGMSGAKKIAILIGIVVVVGITVSLVIGGFRTIQTGTVGIKTTFGQASDVPLQAGMQIVNPFTDNVIPMSIQIQKESQTASAASKDLQDVQIAVVVNYKIDADGAVEIFKTLGTSYADKIIDPRVSEVVKSVSAKFNAGELITNRETVRNQIQTALTSSLKQYQIDVQGVQITNFKFSEEFTKTIEQSQVAKQQQVTQQNVLAKVKIDAQQKVVTASAQKNATILDAEGKAQSTLINAKAEADAIALVQKQLTNSPNYVEYFKVKTWDGVLPKVSDGQGGNIITLPESILLGNQTNNTK